MSTTVTTPEITYETVSSSPVEIETIEQEPEYILKHKKSMSTEEKTEEIVVSAPVPQVEIPQEQHVVVPPPIVDDEEIVKEVAKYPKRETFFAKIQRKRKEKAESKQRDISNRFKYLTLGDVSRNVDKENDNEYD